MFSFQPMHSRDCAQVGIVSDCMLVSLRSVLKLVWPKFIAISNEYRFLFYVVYWLLFYSVKYSNCDDINIVFRNKNQIYIYFKNTLKLLFIKNKGSRAPLALLFLFYKEVLVLPF